MTKTKLKNFLIKKKSYLRWSDYRLYRKFYTMYDANINNNFTLVLKAKKSAKNYLKKKGISW